MSVIRFLVIGLTICLVSFLIDRKRLLKDDSYFGTMILLSAFFFFIALIFYLIYEGVVFLFRFAYNHLDWVADNSVYIFIGSIILIALANVLSNVEEKEQGGKNE